MNNLDVITLLTNILSYNFGIYLIASNYDFYFWFIWYLSILSMPYNSSAKAKFLYSLIVKSQVWEQSIPKAKEATQKFNPTCWLVYIWMVMFVCSFKLMWPITPRLLEKMEADTAYRCLQSSMWIVNIGDVNLTHHLSDSLLGDAFL